MVPAKASFAAPAETSSSTPSDDSARPHYIEFPQMASSILDGYRVRGMIILGFGLEIEDDRLRKKARSLLPRLQDTYTSEWNRYAANSYRSGTVPDAEKISQRMQYATDRMLGEGKAIFLISNLMVRQN